MLKLSINGLVHRLSYERAHSICLFDWYLLSILYVVGTLVEKDDKESVGGRGGEWNMI